MVYYQNHKLGYYYKRKSSKGTVVMIGASTGIGRSLAIVYGKQRPGYNILLISRRIELLQNLANEIEELRDGDVGRGWVRPLEADICTASGISAIKGCLMDLQVDYLVYNAGIISCLSIEELAQRSDKQEIIHAVFETNVFAPMNLTLSLLDIIKRSRTRIVVVSSW